MPNGWHQSNHLFWCGRLFSSSLADSFFEGTTEGFPLGWRRLHVRWVLVDVVGVDEVADEGMALHEKPR